MILPPTSATYTAARGTLGKNTETLRAMLANCAEVQTLFGAANATDALLRIFLGCLPQPVANKETYSREELELYRPMILIGPSPELSIQSNHETFGGSWTHGRQGISDILIERNHPTTGRDDVNDIAWWDVVDMIRQSHDTDSPGLIQLHELPGNLSIRQVEILDIYRGAEEDIHERGDYQRALMRIHWGRI